MKILFFNKQISIGGAERKHLVFANHLIKDCGDTCGFLSWPTKANRVTSLGSSLFIYKNADDVIKIVEEFKPDIIHTTRSGEPEETFDKPLSILKDNYPIIESNVFGKSGGVCHYKLPISSQVFNQLMNVGVPMNSMEIMWNATEYPRDDVMDLRDELGIPQDAYVFGRISRSDNVIFSDLEVRAYEKFSKDINNNNYYYLSLGTPPIFRDRVNGLHNVISLPETADDKRIGSEFFWFASETDYSPEEPQSILAPIWYTPLDNKPHSLLE